jgi:Zn-dependent alcohol dehydrogenase
VVGQTAIAEGVPMTPAQGQVATAIAAAAFTTKYRLEDINQGYQDMKEGKNIRGMVVYPDADR